MNGHADVRRQRAHLDRKHAFGDQIACSGSANADAEHALGLRIDEQLGKPFGPVKCDCAPRCRPRKFRDRHLPSLFFGLRLGQAGPGDFGIGEYHRRNRRWLECNFVSSNRLNRATALMHRLVRQHRLAGNIANGVDRGIGRLALLVDFDESLWH